MTKPVTSHSESVKPGSMPSAGPHLRLLRQLKTEVEAQDGTADERPEACNPFDADLEPLYGVIEKLRELRNSPEATELWNAAIKTCCQQMECKDLQIKLRGMRFFMAMQRQRTKVYDMEMEVVMSALRLSTQITVAQIRNSSSARGRVAKGRAASTSPRS